VGGLKPSSLIEVYAYETVIFSTVLFRRVYAKIFKCGHMQHTILTPDKEQNSLT